MKSKKNRLTALLLAFVMAACFFWDIPVHAEGVSSPDGAGEKTSAVSESPGPAASSGSEGGAQSEAGQPAGGTSSEGKASEAPSSEEQPSEAGDSSSEPEASYKLKKQTLDAAVYTDETLEEESDDGAAVTVEGRLPEDAGVKAYPVKIQDFDEGKVLAAYDITIYGPDGEAFQPEDSVQVSISAPELEDADSVDVYHLKDAEDDGDAEQEDADGKETAEEEKDEAEGDGKDEPQDAEEDGAARAKVELDGSTKTLKAAKVAEGVKPKSKKVRFKADSFSIYVVTAAASDNNGIDISKTTRCTIQVGETLTLYDSNSWNKRNVHWSVDPSNSSIVKLEQKSDWNHWNYGTYATVEGLKTGKVTITCQYSFYWYRSWKTANDRFTVTVDAAGELNPVDTLDSTELGVQMEMFDYDYDSSGSFSILNSNPGGSLCTDPQEGYGDGTTKEGLLQRVVGSDGFPHTIDAGRGYDSQPMSKWFTENGSEVNETRQAVNHLFLQDYYKQTGSFHYSSAENFASLAENGNFTVYQELGTPSNDNRYYYQRGNFLPYNTINNMRKSSNQNEYDLYGKQLDNNNNDLKKDDPLYLMDQAVDYHFGMYMNTDFLQPADGKIKPASGNSEDMVFKFTGDDDLWVYIDGVLVLDLGGIHDAQSGTIDFSTGVVTWTDTPTGESKETGSTSIKGMLDNAVENSGNLPDGTQISRAENDSNQTITYTVKQGSEESTKIVLKKNTDGKYTYEDYSRHTLQMFYMERGSGASNLAIDFNLQTVPKNSVSVTKQVEGLNPFWADQKEYKMKLYVQDANDDYELQKDLEYTIRGETEGKTYRTGNDGTFSLKAGQTAVFSGIDVNKRYYVEETDPDSDGITYKTTFSAGGEGSVNQDGSRQSSPVSVKDTSDMAVTNTAQGTGSITVTKKLEGFTGENFDADFTLYKVDENGGNTVIQTASYDDFKDPDDNNGNKFYTFTGLPYGTYYVVETNPTEPSSGILKTTYTVENTVAEEGSGAQVTLNEGSPEGEILVTNTYYGEYTLPKAGGSGTLPFQIIGTVILLGAAAGLGFWLYRNKKKKGAPPKDSS